MRPPVELFLVDAFTDTPFKGNPAAVCLLPQGPDEGGEGAAPGASTPEAFTPEAFTDAWMQSVAMEMNLSETAFLTSRLLDDTRDQACYDLRWFTPTTEVYLCGHATLAAAHILWERGYADTCNEISFHTKSGVLLARRSGELIELDFPVDPVTEVPAPGGIAQALGVEPIFTGRGRDDYLIEIKDEAQVRSLSPDITALKKIPVASDGFVPRGFIVTAKAGASPAGEVGQASEVAEASKAGYDFVSRFFAPSAGIDEDPVTGSAHCTLAAFWAGKLGKTEMTGYQASKRGGFVKVRLEGERVTLGGQAVTVYAGCLEG